VINNYVDLDMASGTLRDWGNNPGTAAKTYVNPRGIVIDVPSFRAMDADFPVIAAADGVITQVIDGNFDRNVACTSNNANLVRVRHDDCSVAIYAHFKQNSVRVAVGQRVTAGQQLAVVGSSGCSSAPHLHFELNAASGTLEEPFATSRWLAPPPYSTNATVMDLNFKAGTYANIDELKDPPPDPATLALNSSVTVASNTGNALVGDVISMRTLRPDGGVANSGNITMTQEYRHTWVGGNPTGLTPPGQWTFAVVVNAGPVTTRRVTVP